MNNKLKFSKKQLNKSLKQTNILYTNDDIIEDFILNKYFFSNLKYYKWLNKIIKGLNSYYFDTFRVSFNLLFNYLPKSFKVLKWFLFNFSKNYYEINDKNILKIFEINKFNLNFIKLIINKSSTHFWIKKSIYKLCSIHSNLRYSNPVYISHSKPAHITNLKMQKYYLQINPTFDLFY